MCQTQFARFERNLYQLVVVVIDTKVINNRYQTDRSILPTQKQKKKKKRRRKFETKLLPMSRGTRLAPNPTFDLDLYEGSKSFGNKKTKTKNKNKKQPFGPVGSQTLVECTSKCHLVLPLKEEHVSLIERRVRTEPNSSIVELVPYTRNSEIRDVVTRVDG